MIAEAECSPAKCCRALAACPTTKDILSRGIASSRQTGRTDAFHCQSGCADERADTP
jgi:hypothetical protein